LYRLSGFSAGADIIRPQKAANSPEVPKKMQLFLPGGCGHRPVPKCCAFADNLHIIATSSAFVDMLPFGKLDIFAFGKVDILRCNSI